MGRAAVVYVVEADNGEVKVGLSGTPYARLSNIKREYGPRRGFTHARLVGMVWTDYPVEVERLAIDSLLPLAEGGEWFRVEPMVALVEVVYAATMFDPCAHVQWPSRPSKRVRRRPPIFCRVASDINGGRP